MRRHAAFAVLAALLAATFTSCTVLESTYRKKAEEADDLAKRHSALQASGRRLRPSWPRRSGRGTSGRGPGLLRVGAAEHGPEGAGRAAEKAAELEKENLRLARAKEEQPAR